MERHMAQTLADIDGRIPDALRVAFGLRRRVSSPPAPPLPGAQQDEDEVANFAAVLLAPRDDDDDDDSAASSSSSGPTDPDPEPEPEGGGQQLRMVFASCYIKDHDEDAHFGHAEAGVIGVADGVGGYRKDGVDAGAFSRGLMHAAYEVACTAVPGTRFCPLALLEQAYHTTAAARTPGASTAAIVSLAAAAGTSTTHHLLRWASVGDSGLAVLRDGRVLRRTRPQQSRFNRPYQLSARRRDSSGSSSRTADSEVGEVAAREGDVVVLGTDGLFDNVSDGEMERVVRMGAALGFAPENMAEVLAGFAWEAARCAGRDTPFSVSLRAQQPEAASFKGGKPDDITVVVAYIVSAGPIIGS